MRQNLVDIAFAADALADIEHALDTLDQRFAVLVGLTPRQRRHLTKMGRNSEAFCRQALQTAHQHPEPMPRGFDDEACQRDLLALGTAALMAGTADPAVRTHGRHRNRPRQRPDDRRPEGLRPPQGRRPARRPRYDEARTRRPLCPLTAPRTRREGSGPAVKGAEPPAGER